MLNLISSNGCSISGFFSERKMPTWKSVALFAATFFVTLASFALRYGKKKVFTKGPFVLALSCSVGAFVLQHLYCRKKGDGQTDVQIDLDQTEKPEIKTPKKISHPLDPSTEEQRERICRYFSDPNHPISMSHLVKKFEQGFNVLTMKDLEEAETIFSNFSSQNSADNQSLKVEQERALQDIAYLKSLKTDWEKDQLQKMFLSEWSSLCKEIDEKKETLNRQNQILNAANLVQRFVAISWSINHTDNTSVSKLHSSIATFKINVDRLNIPPYSLLTESYRDLESRFEVFNKKFDQEGFYNSFQQSFKEKQETLQRKHKEYRNILKPLLTSAELRFINGYRGTENLEELKILLKEVHDV